MKLMLNMLLTTEYYLEGVFAIVQPTELLINANFDSVAIRQPKTRWP